MPMACLGAGTECRSMEVMGEYGWCSMSKLGFSYSPTRLGHAGSRPMARFIVRGNVKRSKIFGCPVGGGSGK